MRLRQLSTISRQLSTNNKKLRTTLKITTQMLKLVGDDWSVLIGDVGLPLRHRGVEDVYT